MAPAAELHSTALVQSGSKATVGFSTSITVSLRVALYRPFARATKLRRLLRDYLCPADTGSLLSLFFPLCSQAFKLIRAFLSRTDNLIFLSSSRFFDSFLPFLLAPRGKEFVRAEELVGWLAGRRRGKLRIG